jgi:hypothetical protein
MDYIDSNVADRFISEANMHVLHVLNHKLENQYFCPYCHTTEQGTIKPVVRLDIKGYDPNLEPDYHEAIIDEEHGPSVMYIQGYVRGRGEYTGASYINYCPMCGRKLNKD